MNIYNTFSNISDLLCLTKKLLNFSTQKNTKSLLILLLLYLCSALLEVSGIGAALPFIYSIVNVDSLKTIEILGLSVNGLGVTNTGSIRIFFGSIFVLLILLSNFSRIFLIAYQARLIAQISAKISNDIFKKIVLQPLSGHFHTSSLNVIGTLTNDVSNSMGILNNLITFFSNFIVIISVVIMIFFLNPTLTLLLFGAVGSSYLISTFLVSTNLKLNSKEVSEGYQSSIKQVQDSLNSIRQIKLGGKEDIFIKNHYDAELKHRLAKSKNFYLSAAPRLIIEGLALAGICIGAVITLERGILPADLLPMLGLIGIALARLLPLFQQIYNAFSSTQGAETSLRKTLALIEKEEECRSEGANHSTINLKSHIELKGIKFRYLESGAKRPNKKLVLNGISLRIEANQITAITGSSGSGKSTLADIIMGLLESESGSFEIDGNLLHPEKKTSWRNSIAHVGQDIYVAEDTIASNIAFGTNADDIDYNKVQWAARMAHIDSFIEAQVQKYKTQLGAQGILLSGGQRQRIGIARALYNQSSLLLLDEATSSLDGNTEDEIIETVRAISEHTCVIFITHRTTTLRKAHKIFQIEDGRVVAEGDFSTLMQTSPIFQSLIKYENNPD
ncbi:ABC transporter ATP-binding protein [Candidatus Ponderosibacter sp. Uisw_141_02]|uniref:ABC transporter ATP-binding protein n=1 Tax=Candidatus Ponderosibacter sp. Uisw_141_02 TaxID=3231000 RepID=UPI003D4BFBA2